MPHPRRGQTLGFSVGTAPESGGLEWRRSPFPTWTPETPVSRGADRALRGGGPTRGRSRDESGRVGHLGQGFGLRPPRSESFGPKDHVGVFSDGLGLHFSKGAPSVRGPPSLLWGPRTPPLNPPPYTSPEPPDEYTPFEVSRPFPGLFCYHPRSLLGWGTSFPERQGL